MADSNKGKNFKAVSDNAVNIGTLNLIITACDMIEDKLLRGNKDDDARQIKAVLDELRARATAGTLATKP